MTPLIARILIALCITLAGVSASVADPIEIGESFPSVELPAPEDAAARTYLGLKNAQPFTLSDVEGKVVLVEVLNVLCPHCRKQTGPYNKLYAMIEADPEARGRIKMLGVAVANSDEAIADFVDIYEVAFPVVSDSRFKLHRALRAGPTPFSIYVLRDQQGERGVVAGTHLGEDDDMEALFDYLKEMLDMQASEFAALPQEAKGPIEELAPPQSPDEVAAMVREAFALQGSELQAFRTVELPGGRDLFAASVLRDGRRQPLFAEVTSRSAICDICHSVHFFYVFDAHGLVLSFNPLHLTKYGNVEWNEEEVAHFRSRVVGKNLAGSWSFDSNVDAVTTATMTSAIIFDDLSQGVEMMEVLQEAGLLE